MATGSKDPRLTLFQHIDFGGDAMLFRDSVADLGVVTHWAGSGVSEGVSSLKIEEGKWQLFTDPNFTGSAVTVGPGSHRWVEDLGFPNDQLRSIRRLGGAADAAGAALQAAMESLPTGTEVVVLCRSNGRFWEVGGPDGTSTEVFARATDPAQPNARFRLLRRDTSSGPWIGLQSVATGLNVQMTPHDQGFVVRAQNTNFDDEGHYWEHFRVEGSFIRARVSGGYVNFVGKPGSGPQRVRGHVTGRQDMPAGREDTATFEVLPAATARLPAPAAEVVPPRPHVELTKADLLQVPRITLYEHIDFGGRSVDLLAGSPNLASDQLDNTISSFVIHAGRWTLFEEPAFRGRGVSLGPGKYRWVIDLGIPNDRVTSVRLDAAMSAPELPGGIGTPLGNALGTDPNATLEGTPLDAVRAAMPASVRALLSDAALPGTAITPPTPILDIGETRGNRPLGELLHRRPHVQGDADEAMDGRLTPLVMVTVRDAEGKTAPGMAVRLLDGDALLDQTRTDQRGLALLRYPGQWPTSDKGLVGAVEVLQPASDSDDDSEADTQSIRQRVHHIPPGAQHSLVEVVVDRLPPADQGEPGDPLSRLPRDFTPGLFDEVIRTIGHAADPLLGGREGSNKFASRRAPIIRTMEVARVGPTDGQRPPRRYLATLRQEWVFLGYSLGELTGVRDLPPGQVLNEATRSVERLQEQTEETIDETKRQLDNAASRVIRELSKARQLATDEFGSTATTDLSKEASVKAKARASLGWFSASASLSVKAKLRQKTKATLNTNALSTSTQDVSRQANDTVRQLQSEVNSAVAKATSTLRDLTSSALQTVDQVSPLLSRMTNLVNWTIYENYAVVTRVQDIVEVAAHPFMRPHSGNHIFPAEDIVEYERFFRPFLLDDSLDERFGHLRRMVEERNNAATPVAALGFTVHFSAVSCSARLRINFAGQEVFVRLRKGANRATAWMRLDHPMTRDEIAAKEAELELQALNDFGKVRKWVPRQNHFWFWGGIQEQIIDNPDARYNIEVGRIDVAYQTLQGQALHGTERLGDDLVVDQDDRTAETSVDLVVPTAQVYPELDPLYRHINRNRHHYFALLLEAALDEPTLRDDLPQLAAFRDHAIWRAPTIGLEGTDLLVMEDVDQNDGYAAKLLEDPGAATIIQVASPGSYGEALQGILELTDLAGRVPPDLQRPLYAVSSGTSIVDMEKLPTQTTHEPASTPGLGNGLTNGSAPAAGPPNGMATPLP